MRAIGCGLLALALLRGQTEIPPVRTSIVITAAPTDEPAIDRKNAEVFQRTLFSRDDQIFHVLDGGINAGQHEGGGKSIEVRRFGFNLDHGGVNGGLKVLVDNIQQNQFHARTRARLPGRTQGPDARASTGSEHHQRSVQRRIWGLQRPRRSSHSTS